MKKKITRNFGIDKCYFKYNSSFLAEKRVKWFETSTVYSSSLREALKLKKNDKYFICLFIFNNKWWSVGYRADQTSMEKSMLRSSILKKLPVTTFFPMHGEYFCKIVIRSVDKYLFYE